MNHYPEPKRSGYEVAIPIFAKWAANHRKTANTLGAAKAITGKSYRLLAALWRRQRRFGSADGQPAFWTFRNAASSTTGESARFHRPRVFSRASGTIPKLAVSNDRQ